MSGIPSWFVSWFNTALGGGTTSTASFSVVASDADHPDGLTGDTPYSFIVARTGDNSSSVTFSYDVVGSGSLPFQTSLIANPTGTVTIPAGAASAPLVIDLDPTGASLAEGFTIAVNGTVPISATASANGTVEPNFTSPSNAPILPFTAAQVGFLVTASTVTAVTPSGNNAVTPINEIVTLADGIARIDPTGNAEEVARIYQAAFHRGADLNGLNYWTAQLDAGTTTIGNVAQQFINSPEFQQDYAAFLTGHSISSSNASLAQFFYQNVLNRSGDSAGVNYWTGQLNSGATQAAVLTSFADSPENVSNTGGYIGDANGAEAYRLYRAAFDRAPDAAGQSYWVGQLQSGATPLSVAQSMISGPEFQADYAGLSTVGFINQLYENVLNRAGDASGVQSWVGQMNGGISQAAVVLNFADGPENRAATANNTHDGWIFLAPTNSSGDFSASPEIGGASAGASSDLASAVAAPAANAVVTAAITQAGGVSALAQPQLPTMAAATVSGLLGATTDTLVGGVTSAETTGNSGALALVQPTQ